MKVHHLFQEQILPISLEQAWAFFSTPRNLDSITPPELGFEIVYCSPGPVHEGQIITYRVKVLPAIWVPWVTEIRGVEAGRSFIDEQLSGPYRLWHHRHLFEAVEDGTRMTDQVHYALPFGPFGTLAHALLVRKKLERIFGFRREELARRFGTI
jgi:ligand-binding SRPBCC domain-containing protein